MNTELPGGADVSVLTYEQSRDALTQVVSALEQGGTSLEQALSLWERGEALAQRCQDWLDGARARIASAAATEEPARE
jgi:exodeoxyribonuclease VII small subunit